MTRYQPRHRRSKTLPRLFVWLGGALLLVLSAMILFRLALIALVVSAALTEEGFAPKDITINRADLSGLSIGSGSLGNGAVTFSSIRVSYTLQSLLNGRIIDLDLIGLSVKGKWGETGISIGSIDLGNGDSDTSADQEPRPKEPPVDRPLPFQRITVKDMTLEIVHPRGLIQSVINTELVTNGLTLEAKGGATIDGPDLTGRTDWTGTWNTNEILPSSIEARVDLQAIDFLIPETGRQVSADIDLQVLAADSAVSIHVDRPITISGPWPDALNLFGKDASAEDRFELSITNSSLGNTLLDLSQSEDGLIGALDFNMALATPLGRGTLESKGWATLGNDGLPQNFEFTRFGVEIDDVQTPNGTISAKVTADGLKGPIAIAAGPILVSGRIIDGKTETASLVALDFSAETDFRLDGMSLAFALKTLAAQVYEISLNDVAVAREPVLIDLSTGADAFQTATMLFGADGSATLTFDTAFNIKAPKVELQQVNSELFFLTEIPMLWLQGYWVSSDGTLDIRARVQDGLWQSELGTVSGIQIDVGGDSVAFSGPFSAAVQLSNQSKARGQSIGVRGHLKKNSNIFISELVSTLPSGKNLGVIDLEYDLESQNGLTHATIGPLSFGGNDISSSDLRPLALPFIPTSGQFAADLSVSIGETHVPPKPSTVLIKDMEIEGAAVRVQRLNAAITLDSAWPPRTTGTQFLAIGMLEAGLPVTNVEATFSMSDADAIEIEQASMSFAEGKVTGGPLQLRLDGGTSKASLQVDNIRLPALAKLTGLEGIEATGSLSGTVPIQIEGADVKIIDGRLTTQTPGLIRYNPNQTTTAATEGQGGMTLALQALEDFRYDSITVGVDGSIQDDLEATLAIKGNNPDLYGGYPIDFNLNLTGELANILRDSLVGYRVPETIKQQLMEFPRPE